MLYLFIPWTAVNLVDYYIVRTGHYAIAEIFEPARHVRPLGLARDRRPTSSASRRWSRSSPPAPVHRLRRQGACSGADISLFIGLPVAGGLYWLLTRNIDVAAEQRLAEQQAAELEEAAHEHRCREVPSGARWSR